MRISPNEADIREKNEIAVTGSDCRNLGRRRMIGGITEVVKC
jgi:hypothetical protein